MRIAQLQVSDGAPLAAPSRVMSSHDPLAWPAPQPANKLLLKSPLTWPSGGAAIPLSPLLPVPPIRDHGDMAAGGWQHNSETSRIGLGSMITDTFPRIEPKSVRDHGSLDFRGYAAASAQARWMAWISSGAGGRGTPGLNCAAMRTRRSWAVMSREEGEGLAGYQGALSRRRRTTAGLWPARWYQVITRDWVNRAKGTVRSTARGVRLRALPAPVMALASLKATSMAHRLA